MESDICVPIKTPPRSEANLWKQSYQNYSKKLKFLNLFFGFGNKMCPQISIVFDRGETVGNVWHVPGNDLIASKQTNKRKSDLSLPVLYCLLQVLMVEGSPELVHRRKHPVSLNVFLKSFVKAEPVQLKQSWGEEGQGRGRWHQSDLQWERPRGRSLPL